MKARQREGWLGATGLALSVLVFMLWPTLDLRVSQAFFDMPSATFPANNIPWVHALYVATPWMSRSLFVLCCLGLLYLKIRPQAQRLGLQRRLIAWVFMAIVGLGVVVDWGLKDNVGRPRPEQLQVFGADKPFVPAFQWSTHCDVNCSFVSGHAASGFSLMAWGMWAGWQRRQKFLLMGMVAGAAIGAVRVAQGGHFFSDVVFSGWAVWLTYLLIRYIWLMLRLRRFRRLRAQAQSLK
jgi:membrane-associated PAP2 superfamily phosphatase